MRYKCVVTNKVANVASDIASPYQFVKQSNNYLCVFLSLEDTVSFGVSNSIAKNLRGVHVHILFMPSGSIGVRRGDGDADNSNII